MELPIHVRRAHLRFECGTLRCRYRRILAADTGEDFAPDECRAVRIRRCQATVETNDCFELGTAPSELQRQRAPIAEADRRDARRIDMAASSECGQRRLTPAAGNLGILVKARQLLHRRLDRQDSAVPVEICRQHDVAPLGEPLRSLARMIPKPEDVREDDYAWRRSGALRQVKSADHVGVGFVDKRLDSYVSHFYLTLAFGQIVRLEQKKMGAVR